MTTTKHKICIWLDEASGEDLKWIVSHDEEGDDGCDDYSSTIAIRDTREDAIEFAKASREHNDRMMPIFETDAYGNETPIE